MLRRLPQRQEAVLAQIPEAHVNETASSKISPRPLHVILVDPLPVVLRGVREYIAESSELKIVGTAQNCTEALSIILAEKPDAVVMDPELGDHVGQNTSSLECGLQLMNEIRSRYTRTQIIALTMNQSASTIRRILQAGAAGYLFKSDALDNLAQVVVDLCHEEVRSYLSPTALQKLARSLNRVEHQEPLPLLTKREREILKLVVSGKDSKRIAEDLGISVRTVNTHRSRILQKAKARSFYELIDFARDSDS